MEFCSNCGSYLKKMKYGFICPRCGNKIQTDAETPQMQTAKTSQSDAIYVDDVRERRMRQSIRRAQNVETLEHFVALQES
jgi:DNA-directed RNA polymerase subunit M/transcription elongation factor TFIIS